MARKKSPKRPPKRLFSHHRHTGKLLPKHHTSYPLVALLLLMVGVLLTHLTLRVRAADVVVTAAANGPLPPSAAVITNPKNGDHFSTIPIPVSGTCPSPYLVKLYRNQVFSGSTQCNNDGTFLIFTDLFPGKNELEARIFNAADQEGPRSGIVTVYYDVPTQPGQPLTPSTPDGPRETTSTLIQPFFITTDIFFKAIYEKEEIEWRFDIVGGTGPYYVTVAWGDGSTTTLQNLRKNDFTVSHVYNRGPEQREYYPVAISASDANGRKATLQVFTILNNRLIPGLGGAGSDDEPTVSDDLLKRILMAWPAYGVTLLMAASFWLGERRGLSIFTHRLVHHFKPRKPRPHRA
jgi:hypothetical protein